MYVLSLKKINKYFERYRKFVLDDYESDWCSACLICNPHPLSEVIPVVFENHHIIVCVQEIILTLFNR